MDAADQPRSLPDDAPLSGRRELPAIHCSLSAAPTEAMREMGRGAKMVERDAGGPGPDAPGVTNVTG